MLSTTTGQGAGGAPQTARQTMGRHQGKDLGSSIHGWKHSLSWKSQQVGKNLYLKGEPCVLSGSSAAFPLGHCLPMLGSSQDFRAGVALSAPAQQGREIQMA